MSNYARKKEIGGQEEFANLIKSVYESSTTSDNITVSELVEEIKTGLLEIMK